MAVLRQTARYVLGQVKLEQRASDCDNSCHRQTAIVQSLFNWDLSPEVVQSHISIYTYIFVYRRISI